MSEQEQAGGLEGVLAQVVLDWTPPCKCGGELRADCAAHYPVEFRRDLADAVRAWLLGQRDVVAEAFLDCMGATTPLDVADAVLAVLTKADQ